MQRDHFLTCSSSNERKEKSLKIIGKKLNILTIPTTIKEEIINRTIIITTTRPKIRNTY